MSRYRIELLSSIRALFRAEGTHPASLDGTQLDGRALKADVAKEQALTPPRSGGYGGGRRPGSTTLLSTPLETLHPWAILMARATSMAAMTNESVLSIPITSLARFE